LQWLRSMVGSRAANPAGSNVGERPAEKTAANAAAVARPTREKVDIAENPASRAPKPAAAIPPKELNGTPAAPTEIKPDVDSPPENKRDTRSLAKEQLDASSPTELSNSLKSLKAGERGWISYEEAAHWFSDLDSDRWDPGRDEAGMRGIDAFAADRQATVTSEKAQRRIYFTRQ
jgi:hypothetical protein